MSPVYYTHDLYPSGQPQDTGSPWDLSGNLCWPPTDFVVDSYGKTTFESYINDLHPVADAKLYPIIAEIMFTKFVPMLEQVVTDLAHPREQRVVPHMTGG